MSRRKFIFTVILLIAISFKMADSQFGIIRDFVHSNLAGLPLIHKKVSFKFDPEVGEKRRGQWEELNGVKGEKLIERLGLGIDGKSEERLAKQRIRDDGHLGGLNFFTP